MRLLITSIGSLTVVSLILGWVLLAIIDGR